MLAKILLTLAVIGIVFFAFKKFGNASSGKEKNAKGMKSKASQKTEVLDLEACHKCGGYHEGGADQCPR